MINLLSYLNEDNILEFETDGISDIKKSLLKNCLQQLPNDAAETIVNQALSNRKLNEAIILRGFALIHLRLDSINSIRMSLGLLQQPVKIDKGKEIQGMFCIVIPVSKCRTYLSLLAHLTRMLSEKGVEEVLRYGKKKEIMHFINRFETG